MRSLLAILLLLLLSAGGRGLEAQDLTGQWTGTATDNGSDKVQKLVLTITEGDSAFGGVLHWYRPETQFIKHLIVSGRFYKKDSVLTIREDSVMDMGVDGVPGRRDGLYPEDGMNPANAVSGLRAQGPSVGFYVLYYRRTSGHKDILEGHWTDPRTGKAEKGEGLTIRLEKKAPPFIPIVLPSHKKKDSTQVKQFETLQSRTSVIAATIPIHGTDSIRIELYDNGEIDGDSVSLYLNDELLLQHQKLTAGPKTLIIPIDKSLPVNRLVLFAENLGKFPPNTALMEVTIHGKTYNLFMSTDYTRNASVEFTLQE